MLKGGHRTYRRLRGCLNVNDLRTARVEVRHIQAVEVVRLQETDNGSDELLPARGGLQHATPVVRFGVGPAPDSDENFQSGASVVSHHLKEL